MRLPGFPTLVFFFIGNVSVCFAADHSEVVAQEPQLNADQVIGEAQRGIDLRTTHSADPLPAGRSNAGNVNHRCGRDHSFWSIRIQGE